MRSRKHQQATAQSQMGTLSELNITPLLDLAFVLLIIFMITAPFLAESADLIIPTSNASNQAVDPSKVQVVSINETQQLALNDEEFDGPALGARLREMFAEDPGLAIVIKADKRLDVEHLVEVMDIVKNAGITKVGVVTKPEGGE